jgi:hypothetical protein
MSEPGRDPHLWLRSRLELYAAQLLDDEELRRFEEHAASCSECAEAMSEFIRNSPTARPDSHIPPRILARWDRAKPRLTGLARELVRRHLEDCVACRQDLEALGFIPAFETPGGEVKASPNSERLFPAPRSVVFVNRPQSRRNPWLVPALSGLLGAAIAATITIAVMPDLVRKPEQSASAPSPAGTQGISSEFPGSGTLAGASKPGSDTENPAIELLGPPLLLRAPTRAATLQEPEIRITPEARFIHLRLPDLYYPDTTLLVVRAYGPKEEVISEQEFGEGLVGPSHTLLIGNSSHVLEPGRYRITVRAKYEPRDRPPIELRFRIGRKGAEP